jgi:hypothetical protein
LTTAVDTNILLDMLIPNPRWEESSRAALDLATEEDHAIIGETVFGELAARFDSPGRVQAFLTEVDIEYVPSNRIALYRAGTAWRRYATRRPRGVSCPRCGHRTAVTCSSCGESIATRQHLIADFIVGAHALTHADRLLTRDRGYYRTCFPDLQLV